MDGVCSEANEENDKIARTVRRRHSSILKPPRSPLQDLRSGNEAVLESNPVRNRKSSRRVSFADTIKIFQTESHTKTLRKSEIAEKEAGENVLLMQNKSPEDNHCEITGMNTLLCAPIQNLMQQREFSVIEHNQGRTHENDHQTVISSDENQMELTASHTVMISKGLSDCTKSEKSTKIDTKSFLASLKLHTEDSKMRKELNVSMDQNTSSEKKINFSDFIKRLKMGKSNASPSKESDKENCDLSVHVKESKNASSIHHMDVSLNVDENSGNRTRIFREQDDGMNFTQCHTANIQTSVPISNKASLREVKSDDITIYGGDFMDLTINRTTQILPSADNLSEIENQTQNVRMDVTTGYGTKSPGKKKTFKNKLNAAFQDSTLSPEDEIHITRSHLMGAETHTVTQACNEDSKSLAMVSESICSSLAVQDYKTVFSSRCSDAMELTKCLSSMREEKILLKHDSNYYKTCPNSDAISLITEKTLYSGEDSMNITKSHTVAIDNQIFKQDQTNVQITATPISEKAMILQNHITVAEDGKMNVNCSSVPHVFKERLQQSLANSLSISLTDRKTKLLTDEDMDLTKCHTGNLGSQTPLASYNLAPENSSKSQFPSKSPSDEWEKMTKNHSEPTLQPNVVSENIFTTTWGKEKDQILKISPCLDKDSPQSVSCNQNVAKTHSIISSGRDLDEEVALGNNRNTVSCEQSLFSTTKPLFSSGQVLMKNHNTTVNSHIVISVPDENSKLPEPLKKSLGSPTLSCSHDKMINCSMEEQNMDLTKSHTVVIGLDPSEVQELGKTNLEHTNSQLTTASREIAVNFEKCDKDAIEKTGVFISNDTEVLEDKTVQKPGFLNEKQNVKTCGRKSVGGLKIDKSILFSESDENDMDITKSCTVEINHRPLSDEHDSHLVPLAGTSKTVLYARGQDDMEITRSHTTALECKPVSPDEVTARLMDKTVFLDNHSDLEMTKSHTVFIDYQAKERTVLPDRPNFELPKMKSLGKLKVTSTPDEESVFFPENSESGHPAAKGSQLTLQGKWCNSGLEKAVPFTADDNMEVCKSTTWKNGKDIQKHGFLNETQSGKCQGRKSLRLKNDKIIAFSESDKNDMGITQSCMVEISHKSALENKEDSHLMPLAGTSKTILYACGQDDMEITRIHTTALECKPVSPDEVTTRPMDKTVFLDNHNDLEMTKSHTVFIDYQAKERTVFPDRPNFELPKMKSLGKPKATSAPNEESVFFSENGESGHPAAKGSQLTLQGKWCNSGLEKAVPFTADDNMEVCKLTTWKNGKDIQKHGFLNETQSGKCQGRKSLRLKNDKIIAFSESDKNDMGITQSCMVEISHKSALEDKEDSHLMPLAGTSKTILYACGQDDMEITRIHTTALECKPVSPDEVTTRPMDKTVFLDNHNDLEMTKSHTVFIDYQAKERTVFPDRPNFELPKMKSLGKPKATSAPNEESVFFSENGESGHPAAKGSQLTLQGKWCNSGLEKAVPFTADDNMEVCKSMTWKNDKDIQKHGFLNETQSGKCQGRKSLRLKNDKIIAFSESDKNDMGITQSCMVEISHKSALEDKEDSHLMPLAGTSKTILYACGQDDMEITRIHTTALECKPVSPDEVTTRPMDKTVMFMDDHNDLEVTKSHTVFIDCQAVEKILQECPKFGITKGENLGVSFPKDDSSFQEITKNQALAIENKIIPHGEQQRHIVPLVPMNTLLGDQGEMEITKLHSTAAGEEVMEKAVDWAYTLEKAKTESCRLNSTDRRNVDFTSSHATVTCRSRDNYSCLPNLVSYVDNLEGNIMSLCDKDKEKASNYPVPSDLAYANDLAAECCLKPEELPISAPCPLLEKTEGTQTNTKGQLDCVITPLKDQDDLVKDLQNLANQIIVGSQGPGEMTRLNSKRVSCKPPNAQMEDFVDNEECCLKKPFVDVCVASQSHLSTQLPPLPQEGQNIVNKDETILSRAEYKNLNIVIGNFSVPMCENEPTIMLNNEKQFTVAYKKELKENMQTTKCGTGTDCHSNSDLTKQVSQTHANLREPSDTVIASDAPSFSRIKPNLNNLNGKTEDILDFQMVPTPPPPEPVLDLANKAPSVMSIAQASDKHIDVLSTSAKDDRNEEDKNPHNGAEINSVSFMTVVKDKVRKCSLGIFLPRLPNKRNCSVTGIDEREEIPADRTDLNHLETQPVFSEDSGVGIVAAKLTLSPSQYINEENLPTYPEINSSDSISIETEEKALIETYQKEISPSENKAGETYTSQKRTWVQEEDDDIQNEKKIRKNEVRPSDTAQDQQIFDHHTEGDRDKSADIILMKSLSRTPPSCSSSLDSIKADGTSLDFSTHRNSQVESQFLRDTICEESLREKLKDGRITIKEFFILLQVHTLIQKPRQSNLPTKFTINIPPTPEDLMLSQYVYGPKIQIYKEDCEALRQKIEELKFSALNQDKLLTDVNKNLWEKMRRCSDEELKSFGVYLNKIKSRFTKMTKVFTHQGKVALYSKLEQSAQNEREKLQIRMHEMDDILKKIDNCLTKVEIETKYLEDEEKDPIAKWDSEMRAAEKELEQLKTKEEELQRNLLELEVQKKQTLAQIDFMKKQTNRTEELLDQLSLSEWDIIEWSDDQAVFTFLYDTVELTITFGEAVVGLPFLNKDYRKIADLNFQSLLDEDKAPPSSLLVHQLIFQYIEEQESWKKKCTTQHQVPEMLQEISLVVSHCKFLGEEIEFLKRWGPNYNLTNIDINNTELRLLFSSPAAFAKFEITLSLSAHYPSVRLPFSVQNHLGNTGQDEIAAILSKVPREDNYLKNVVKQIYRDLLQECRFHR